MELIAFIVLLILGFFTLIFESRNFFRLIYLPMFLVFIFIMRLHGFYFGGYQKDILTYAIEMHAISFDIYYLREFIFWLPLKIIYMLTNSEFITLLILDIAWMYFLFKAVSQESLKKLGKGIIVVLATSFPFFFGYENIYRQFYASIILLWSYSLIDKNSSKAVKLFFISFFIHNLVLFLLPIFLVKKCLSFNMKDRITISSVASVLFVLILPFIANFKDADPTKVDMSMAYMILFLGSLLFFILKFKDNVYKIINEIPSLLFSTILMIGYVVFRQEMVAERLGMMFLIFLIYDLYSYSTKIEIQYKRILLRVSLLLIFSLPVLLFYSSMRFLN
jgi:hypothetical protein